MVAKGTHLTEETKRKMSMARKGKNHLTEDGRRRLSEAHKGRKFSAEHIKKLSVAHKGNIKNAEHLRKLHDANKGRRFSPKHIIRLSEAHKGKKHNTEHKRKNAEHLRRLAKRREGKKLNVETCRRISEANKGKKFSQEHIRKLSGKSNHSWRGGISFLPYCHKFNEQLKERIRNRDNRTCQLCGERENGRKLDVHHVHYDKENCDPDLIALCFRCNAKANTNRDYYEGLFMKKLEERGLLIRQTAIGHS